MGHETLSSDCFCEKKKHQETSLYHTDLIEKELSISCLVNFLIVTSVVMSINFI